jgi:hypothetical protein
MSLAAKTPELASKINAPTVSNGTRSMPPVSGSSLFEPEGAELLIALALEADALADAPADGLGEVLPAALADAEAPGIALAEALEVGLAITLASIPLSSILPEPIPPEYIP